MGRRVRERWLDGATGLLLLVALGVFAQERILPAWRARELLEPGDRVPATLTFRTLATGDTLHHLRGTPALLLVFRSDCPACLRNTPAWQELLRRLPARARSYGIGFESDPAALGYVREGIPTAVAVAPLEPDRFLRRFGIGAVPTTLFIDRGGRLSFRSAGPLSREQVDAILVLAESAAVARGGTRIGRDAPFHPSP